jgi:hypothetical protein
LNDELKKLDFISKINISVGLDKFQQDLLSAKKGIDEARTKIQEDQEGIGGIVSRSFDTIYKKGILQFVTGISQITTAWKAFNGNLDYSLEAQTKLNFLSQQDAQLQKRIADAKREQAEYTERQHQVERDKARGKAFEEESKKAKELTRQAELDELDSLDKIAKEREFALDDLHRKMIRSDDEVTRNEIQAQIDATNRIYNVKRDKEWERLHKEEGDREERERKEIESNAKIEAAHQRAIYETAQAAQQAMLNLNGGTSQTIEQMAAVVNRIARSVERMQ